MNAGLSSSEVFPTASEMPHYKVWINNTSNHPYNVTITSDSSTGPVQKEIYRSSREIRNDIYLANDLGTRYVNITSSGGNGLKGRVTASVVSTRGEIN